MLRLLVSFISSWWSVCVCCARSFGCLDVHMWLWWWWCCNNVQRLVFYTGICHNKCFVWTFRLYLLTYRMEGDGGGANLMLCAFQNKYPHNPHTLSLLNSSHLSRYILWARVKSSAMSPICRYKWNHPFKTSCSPNNRLPLCLCLRYSRWKWCRIYLEICPKSRI